LKMLRKVVHIFPPVIGPRFGTCRGNPAQTGRVMFKAEHLTAVTALPLPRARQSYSRCR
jgi:hypothetical protein